LERSNHEAQSGLRFTNVVMHRQIHSHSHRSGPIKRLSGAQRSATERGSAAQLTVVTARIFEVEICGNLWQHMEIHGNLWKSMEIYENGNLYG
jgi:hypothetical protein